MSSIKVVEINEEVKQEAPIEEVKQEEHEVSCSIREPIEEVKQEAPIEEVNEVIEEHAKIKPQDATQEPRKLCGKLITCPKCSKSMKLKSYRYKHEKTCQGTLEQKPVKPFSKPRAKPKAQPKAQPKIENTIQKQEVVELPSPQATQPQLTPYEIARQSYIQMKEAHRARKIEKINMFKSKMF